MKYSWEFKLKCVKNYKAGIKNIKPDQAKYSDKNFNDHVNIELLHGEIINNYRLGDDITSKILTFVFGLNVEVERI